MNKIINFQTPSRKLKNFVNGDFPSFQDWRKEKGKSSRGATVVVMIEGEQCIYDPSIFDYLFGSVKKKHERLLNGRYQELKREHNIKRKEIRYIQPEDVSIICDRISQIKILSSPEPCQIQLEDDDVKLQIKMKNGESACYFVNVDTAKSVKDQFLKWGAAQTQPNNK